MPVEKERFGAFVAERRRAQGLTQKELAERLHVTDKAVSKWERGLSLPDIALLTPLAEQLGVTVTQLLDGQAADQPSDAAHTETLVRTALAYGEQEQRRALNRKRLAQSAVWLLVVAAEVGMLTVLGFGPSAWGASACTAEALALCFGLTFQLYIKERLPSYYDEHAINFYVDGFMKLHLPVRLTNRNWPYIVRAVRVWAVGCSLVAPLCALALRPLSDLAAEMVMLAALLGSLFVPMIVAGKRHV